MKRPSIFTLLLLIVTHSQSALACVGCREPGSLTLAQENPTVLAGVAFSWSVLFMLGFVMTIVFAMSLYIWRTCQGIEESRAGK